jgi:hypothetical protein
MSKKNSKRQPAERNRELPTIAPVEEILGKRGDSITHQHVDPQLEKKTKEVAEEKTSVLK